MKNIIRTMIIVSALLVPFHAHSMQNAALKAFLTKAGTILGVGVATNYWLDLSGRYAYYYYTKDGIDLLKKDFPDREFRKPTIEEENFIRKNANLQDDTKLYIVASDNRFPGGFPGICSRDTTIAIPERLPGFEKTLAQAIKDKDYGHESCFIAVAQHEEGHKKEKHTLKSTICSGIIPTISTAAIAKACKTVAPYNPQASLINHVARFMGKTLGGYALFYAYQKAYYTYGKYHEFQADQHVKPAYQPYLMQVLDGAEYVEDIMKQTGKIKKQAAWREWILDDHPTKEQRCAALGLVKEEPTEA